MNQILLISLNTVREHLRDKLFYNLAFFALLLIGSAVLLSRLTIGDYQRVLIDVGLGTINLIGVIIAVFIGIGLISRELQGRTLYLVLSKPVPRWHLVLGKYFGLLLTLLLNMMLMVTGLVLVLWAMEVPVTLGLFQAILATYLECAVVTAIAVAFSAFTTSTLSVMCTLALFVIGHSVTSLRVLGERSGEAVKPFFIGMIYLLPNFEHFNLRSHVVHKVTVPAVDVLILVGYASAYAAILLMIATMVFQHRDVQ
jgi:ABC-type transport system involved in multi-copper enzyme maturation permease subunit